MRRAHGMPTPSSRSWGKRDVPDFPVVALYREHLGRHPATGSPRYAKSFSRSPKARLSRQIVQLVAGPAPARLRSPQHTPREQVVDVAQRRVWRALGDRRPLAAGELTFKAIEQLVQQLHLSLVQWRGCPALPEPRLGQ